MFSSGLARPREALKQLLNSVPVSSPVLQLKGSRREIFQRASIPISNAQATACRREAGRKRHCGLAVGPGQTSIPGRGTGSRVTGWQCLTEVAKTQAGNALCWYHYRNIWQHTVTAWLNVPSDTERHYTAVAPQTRLFRPRPEVSDPCRISDGIIMFTGHPGP